MYACPTDSPLLHSCIQWCVCPCMALQTCLSHPFSSLTPWLKYVHASVHRSMASQLPTSAPPLCTLACKMCGPLWSCRHVPVIHLLVLHLGLNVYVHQYKCACPPDSPDLLYPLCTVACKHVYPHVASSVCPRGPLVNSQVTFFIWL